MQENINPKIGVVKVATKTTSKHWQYIIMIALVCSFVFVSAFKTFEYGNGSAFVVGRETAGSAFWSYTLYLTLISWLIFELLMRGYYILVSFSMYVFIVPKKEAHYTLRAVYAVRNVVVGLFNLILFTAPFIINFLPFIALVVDFGSLLLAFWWLKKRYFGTLLAPFAFKALFRPFLIYEAIMVIFSVLGGALL